MELQNFKRLMDARSVVQELDVVAFMSDISDRTLIYGFTLDRETFHVYIQDKIIHRITYNENSNQPTSSLSGERFLLTELVPNKRIYPEASDFKFCTFLQSQDIDLPFTTFNPNRPVAKFYGETVESLLSSGRPALGGPKC
jgi:hypothetical protein